MIPPLPFQHDTIPPLLFDKPSYFFTNKYATAILVVLDDRILLPLTFVTTEPSSLLLSSSLPSHVDSNSLSGSTELSSREVFLKPILFLPTFLLQWSLSRVCRRMSFFFLPETSFSFDGTVDGHLFYLFLAFYLFYNTKKFFPI